jgi:hypothetical protein
MSFLARPFRVAVEERVRHRRAETPALLARPDVHDAERCKATLRDRNRVPRFAITARNDTIQLRLDPPT